MLYKLIIKDLKIKTKVRLFEEEKVNAQEFLVNLEIDTLLDMKDVEDDTFFRTACYGKVREKVIKIFTDKHTHTLETLSFNISREILSSNPSHKNIKLSILKTEIFDDSHVGVEVSFDRSILNSQ